jgi:hypothetical protein
MSSVETLSAGERRLASVLAQLDAARAALREQGVEPPSVWLREAEDAKRRIAAARQPDALDHPADLLCELAVEGYEAAGRTLTADELYAQVLEWEAECLAEIASKLVRLAVAGDSGSAVADRIAEITLAMFAAETVEDPGDAASHREAVAAWWTATLRDEARLRALRASLLPSRRTRLPRRGVRVRARGRGSSRAARRRPVRAGPARPRSADEPDPPPLVDGRP